MQTNKCDAPIHRTMTERTDKVNRKSERERNKKQPATTAIQIVTNKR